MLRSVSLLFNPTSSKIADKLFRLGLWTEEVSAIWHLIDLRVTLLATFLMHIGFALSFFDDLRLSTCSLYIFTSLSILYTFFS